MANKPQPIQVERSENEPTPKKILDKEIVALAKAAKMLITTGLQREDLVTLVLTRARGINSRTDVRAVIDAVAQLGRDYAIKP